MPKKKRAKAEIRFYKELREHEAEKGEKFSAD